MSGSEVQASVSQFIFILFILLTTNQHLINQEISVTIMSFSWLTEW